MANNIHSVLVPVLDAETCHSQSQSQSQWNVCPKTRRKKENKKNNFIQNEKVIHSFIFFDKENETTNEPYAPLLDERWQPFCRAATGVGRCNTPRWNKETIKFVYALSWWEFSPLRLAFLIGPLCTGSKRRRWLRSTKIHTEKKAGAKWIRFRFRLEFHRKKYHSFARTPVEFVCSTFELGTWNLERRMAEGIEGQ